MARPGEAPAFTITTPLPKLDGEDRTEAMKITPVVYSLALTTLILAGCAGTPTPGHIQPGKMGAVSTGMTKEQVVKAIGQPASVAADGKSETLIYVEERPWWQWVNINIKLVDGKVVEFGQETRQ